MLENLSRDPPREAALGESAQLIPDPWDLPSAQSERVPMPENGKLPVEPHALIEAAGSPEAPRLRGQSREPELRPVQILWQGE
ncbi:hypothetical protein [Microseira sp. BLCC-F43]|jgi:hypothetical protein|uniref:hypothetical protein n=1 Tax=Microseira sp. BLCC-F43 TaxID=3153602 RepID=UPI0035B9BFDB